MMGRVLTLILALVGAGLFSQAPEFAQQYRQALGVAVGELEVIVRDFDAASARAGLTRQEALAQYRVPDNSFLTERGTQLGATLTRYETLSAQALALESAGPIERILLIARDPDPTIVAGARDRFEPAIPLTLAGGLMAAFGWLAGWLAGRVGGAGVRAAGRMAKGLAPGPRRAVL